MVTVRIDTSQVNTLIGRMERGGDQAVALCRTVVRKAAIDIKARGQAYAPVDTGNLRGSISYEVRPLAAGAVAEIGPTADYGEYVEFGTSRQAPQLYMSGAFDDVAPQLEAALEQIAARFLT